MVWRRLGRVFCPENRSEWMYSHTANPFAEPLEGDLFRVYFSCRDRNSRSRVGFVDIDLVTLKCDQIAEQPVLSVGEAGTFDDSGISLGCIVKHDGDRYLYYLGWNLAVTVPWRNSIGLAISRDGGPFTKHAPAPVLDRNVHDPYSLSYPWVMKHGAGWQMWYGSHVNWGRGDRDMEHVIKYAESEDGIAWKPTGLTCLEVRSDDSYVYSRPCVAFEDRTYRMWFSYRGEHYAMGYAESADGVSWRRMDERGGFRASGRGWDATAVEYGHVFPHQGRRYLAYCGDGYGRTGFGLAVEEES